MKVWRKIEECAYCKDTAVGECGNCDEHCMCENSE